MREQRGKFISHEGDTKTKSSTDCISEAWLLVHVNRAPARQISLRDRLARMSLKRRTLGQLTAPLLLSSARRTRLKSLPTTIGSWQLVTSFSSSPNNYRVLEWSAGPYTSINLYLRLVLHCKMSALRKKEPFLQKPTSQHSSLNTGRSPPKALMLAPNSS
jgi:hypothetical protein